MAPGGSKGSSILIRLGVRDWMGEKDGRGVVLKREVGEEGPGRMEGER